MAQSPYSQTPASNFKTYNQRGHITPNFEFSEGERPAGEFMPAPYLPLVRYEGENLMVWTVVSAGKPVALDSNGNVVLAGLAIDAAAWKAAADATGVAAGDAAAKIKYTQTDVDNGLRNAAGVLVTVGEPVVKSFFNVAGGAPFAAVVTVSNAVGVAQYNYYQHPGGDGENPATFTWSNFNLQNKVAFICDYQIELPLVQDDAAYAAAPFKGIAAFIAPAGTAKPGEFVAYDVNSNFVAVGYDYTLAQAPRIIGQILSKNLNQVNGLLNLVRSSSRGIGALDQMPGTATGGKSDTLTYSNGYGVVRVNLQNR